MVEIEQCIMCKYGDIEHCYKEECITQSAYEDNYETFVYKASYITKPIKYKGKRAIIKMVPIGSHIHIRWDRKPLQGRSDSVLVVKYLDKDCNEIKDVEECGTDQISRLGSVSYIKNKITSMDIEHAKHKTRSPWYPGIHFHMYFKDVVNRI